MTKGTSLDHRRRKGRGTARPFKKIETTATDDEIFESLIETFPASDPPALHVLDFVSSRDRKIVQDEVWPLVLRAGRWKGELDLRHFGSGMPIAFLIDCFRIDDPRTGEPMNVATVSRDLTAQKNSEAALRHLNETLERRVKERTFELADANRRLLAEKLEREQADLRFQRLQNELSRAARLTAAGQMAAALAHEISQPLTAVVNSVSEAKAAARARGVRSIF